MDSEATIAGRVPELNDANFAGAAPVLLPAAKAEVPLTAYQYRAIGQKGRIVVRKWCRQSGKDFTTSLEAILDALDTGSSWYIVSLTQRQALATAKKAQMHMRAIGLALPEIVEEPWELQSGAKITTFGVRLPGGGEVVALPGKDPDALAGLTGNVIFTEMALFPNNGVDHWRVVFPLITKGFKLRAISTPRGPETKFAELCRNAQGKYTVDVVTIHDAVAGGLELRDDAGKPITPDELEALYADPAGWRREYLCEEGQDHEALIEWQYIRLCEAAYDCPVREVNGTSRLQDQLDPRTAFAAVRAAMHGRPVLGWDIAATGDLSVVALGEALGDVVFLRMLVLMAGVDDFEYQEAVVRAALGGRGAGVGDKTGLGREACQRIERQVGEHRFKGVVFTQDARTELGIRLMKQVQSARLRIPADRLEIGYDLHSMARETAGVAGRLRLVAQTNPLLRRSHCDVFWALAMMVDAADAPAGDQPSGSLVGEASGLVTEGTWL